MIKEKDELIYVQELELADLKIKLKAFGSFKSNIILGKN